MPAPLNRTGRPLREPAPFEQQSLLTRWRPEPLTNVWYQAVWSEVLDQLADREWHPRADVIKCVQEAVGVSYLLTVKVLEQARKARQISRTSHTVEQDIRLTGNVK